MYINQMSYGYNHSSNLKGVHIHKKEMKKKIDFTRIQTMIMQWA